MVILKPNEHIDRALRRLKKELERDNVIDDYKKHLVYIKPGEKRRQKKVKARWRKKKDS